MAAAAASFNTVTLSMVVGSRLSISIGMPSTKTKGDRFPIVTPRILIIAASPPGKPLDCVTVIPVTPPCRACDKEVIGLLFSVASSFTCEMEEILFSFRSSVKPVTITSSSALIFSSSEMIRFD